MKGNGGSYRNALIQGGRVAAACACGVWAAELLGLEYAVTAGIIAILSIGSTKKETLKTARNRGLAFLCAIGISAVCFHVFGYHIWAFGIYVLCFVMVCLLAGWPEAMAMDSVLISHFLVQESMSLYWICNETLLFLIGTGFGILANALLRRRRGEFQRLSDEVDKQIVGILSRMAMRIRSGDKTGYDGSCFDSLDHYLQNARICAVQNFNNSLMDSECYEMDYVEMRQKQRMVLEEIYKSIIMIESKQVQAGMVAAFIEQVAEDYHRENPVTGLLEQMEAVFIKMEEEPLPGSREEFEARAILFYILKQLREFLLLKCRFMERYQKNRARGETSY